MSYSVPSSSQSGTQDGGVIAEPLRRFVRGDPIVTVGVADPDRAGTVTFAHAPLVLQDVGDYRGAIRRWFGMLRIGGRLAIEVPHSFLCERELALPSRRHPSRRRLYTPATLLAEVEEALEPNSYRVRLACDHDDGYDYARGDDAPRVGAHGILLVIERIELPAWQPDTGEVADGAPPDFAFEPAWTRQEVFALAPRRRILILKLDHLGDFIMGVPALEAARRVFSNAEITLVVGSWNLPITREIDVADTIVAFDAFPRNSTEEAVDLPARVAAFRQTVIGAYDVAIDLRTDPDTRFFLEHVEARLRAGLGTRAQFGFLDIFLPIDFSRLGFEAAWEKRIEHHDHAATGECRRTPFCISYDPGARSTETQFMIWGPYVPLQVGEYIYEPFIDVGGDGADLVLVDVAVDMKPVASALVSASTIPHLRFSIEEPALRVEFRVIQPNKDAHVGFRFYGGRLLKRGASSVLHQAEYLTLLIDLVEMRTNRFGVQQSDASTA